MFVFCPYYQLEVLLIYTSSIGVFSKIEWHISGTSLSNACWSRKSMQKLGWTSMKNNMVTQRGISMTSVKNQQIYGIDFKLLLNSHAVVLAWLEKHFEAFGEFYFKWKKKEGLWLYVVRLWLRSRWHVSRIVQCKGCKIKEWYAVMFEVMFWKNTSCPCATLQSNHILF